MSSDQPRRPIGGIIQGLEQLRDGVKISDLQARIATLEAEIKRLREVFAGIDDPAAFVAEITALREAVRVLAKAHKWLSYMQCADDEECELCDDLAAVESNPIAKAALDAARSRT